MRITLEKYWAERKFNGDRNEVVEVLVYTYDPAEQALVVGMYNWCDAVFGDCTHQHNSERLGYPIDAHSSGFDLKCTSMQIRMFLDSWRKFFEPGPALDAVDHYVVRSS